MGNNGNVYITIRAGVAARIGPEENNPLRVQYLNNLLDDGVEGLLVKFL